LIACGIDANSNVVLLAWALVPIKDEIWWNWFLIYLKASYPCKSRKEPARLKMVDMKLSRNHADVQVLLLSK
jgi:hypothetical protein